MAHPVVLFGGASSERLVSTASAQNIVAHLPQAVCWFLSPSGSVHPVGREALLAHPRPFEVEFTVPGQARFPTLQAALDAPDSRTFTFFLALHGGDGENGVLQAEFERRGIAFTGSGSLASALAFDKDRTRRCLAAEGAVVAFAQLLPVLPREELERTLAELFRRGPRWVLKPVSDGSSVGLEHLRSRAEIPLAAERLASRGVRYLAEEFIDGRELTVGVVAPDDELTALPPSEVVLEPDAAFDYQGKYLGRGTKEITPANITPEDCARAQALAVLAHRTVGCEGYSRSDMILRGGEVVFLEINTLPGLTRASFIPQQLAAAGRSLADFLAQQVRTGQRRASRPPP